MSSAAEQAAAVFATNGTTWQERPVKPPPYVPTAEQLQNVFADLLSKVLAGKASDGSDRHALYRGLRVNRLTKPSDPEQRFVLQVQTSTGPIPEFQPLEIVGADGKPAEWTPPPPVPEESKAALRAQIAELQAQVQAHTARLEELGASIEQVKP